MSVVHTLFCTILYVSVGVRGSFPIRLSSFIPILDKVTGSIVCGRGIDVTSTSAAETILECSRLCAKNALCVTFAYYESTTPPTCEQFSTTNRACYTVVPGCSYYQKTTTPSVQLYVNTSCNPSILIQQHYNGTKAFNKSWAQFKVAVGSPSGDYWIGNEQLHDLTKDGRYSLLVDVQAKNNGQWYRAEYSTFIVDAESTGYTLHVGGYNGTAGDVLSAMDGMKFTTYDQDNDLNSGLNCANQPYSVGGFWFDACTGAYVNNADSAPNKLYGFMWGGLPIGTVSNNTYRGLTASRFYLLCSWK